ncbi:ArsR/SmtB family transcription factor [Sanguibacter sp. A247]|uniref:ArsR/SmtB family transcription factor n=1 Tax=unclassified Sanguibacter TaxID=2645534 RepID=UPI003FD76CEB
MTHDDPTPRHHPEPVGPAALKALAHPLRVALFDAIAHAPATASMLADQLGESSGATSYHLRQLARHGLVREATGRGRGRERWWEKVPGGVVVGADHGAAPAEKEAGRMVVSELIGLRERALRAFLGQVETLDDDWRDASLVSTTHLDLTAEAFSELVGRLTDVVNDFAHQYGGENEPVAGSRSISVQMAAFPVVGGRVTP